MTLDDLADEEERLLQYLKQRPSIAEIEQAGVFAAYHRVHSAYAMLILDPASGMEALKRALFLQWYGWLEPLHITGIREVDPDLQWQVIHQLDQLIGHGGLDRELAGMLARYNSQTCWFFDEEKGLPTVGNYMERTYSALDRGEGFPSLQAYLRTAPPEGELAAVFTTQGLMHRGHMGAYFLMMLQAQGRYWGL